MLYPQYTPYIIEEQRLIKKKTPAFLQEGILSRFLNLDIS